MNEIIFTTFDELTARKRIRIYELRRVKWCFRQWFDMGQ